MEESLYDISYCDFGSLWGIPFHVMLNKPGQGDRTDALIYNGLQTGWLLAIKKSNAMMPARFLSIRRNTLHWNQHPK